MCAVHFFFVNGVTAEKDRDLTESYLFCEEIGPEMTELSQLEWLTDSHNQRGLEEHPIWHLIEGMSHADWNRLSELKQTSLVLSDSGHESKVFKLLCVNLG